MANLRNFFDRFRLRRPRPMVDNAAPNPFRPVTAHEQEHPDIHGLPVPGVHVDPAPSVHRVEDGRLIRQPAPVAPAIPADPVMERRNRIHEEMERRNRLHEELIRGLQARVDLPGHPALGGLQQIAANMGGMLRNQLGGQLFGQGQTWQTHTITAPPPLMTREEMGVAAFNPEALREIAIPPVERATPPERRLITRITVVYANYSNHYLTDMPVAEVDRMVGVATDMGESWIHIVSPATSINIRMDETIRGIDVSETTVEQTMAPVINRTEEQIAQRLNADALELHALEDERTAPIVVHTDGDGDFEDEIEDTDEIN